jgi:hypothetical protein
MMTTSPRNPEVKLRRYLDLTPTSPRGSISLRHSDAELGRQVTAGVLWSGWLQLVATN